ncbi:magnesium transporter [Rhizobium sp. RU20A]|uniref:magnesium/cobalt transporter CorA n=1 Tax=Rhizobium sp. RU20A TaxID=1907412 RepID=UPI000953E01C|nr:magnesium/cobalt transporter CorA [Rhizobium sp. RU20A]SIQ73216.1 magnesium transporter [Rhizobium sp. RU20A]
MLQTYSSRPVLSAQPDETPAGMASGARPIWFDLLNPTPAETREVEAHLGIEIPTRDEMQEIELSARLYQEAGAEFMTVTVATELDGDEPVKAPISFIMKDGTLVTVRYADPKPFQLFAARLQRQNGTLCDSGEQVLLCLIEATVDRMADVLERVGNDIDAVSREVFSRKKQTVTKKTRNLEQLIAQIGGKGEVLTTARESLVSIARMVAYYMAVEGKALRKSGKDSRQRMKLVQRDAASLGDHAQFLSAKINFLLDATLGLINLEQNQIIKIFSVAAVVFLPPTLVASIYGMNFQLMPELSWQFGYPFAIGLMMLSALLPYLYFKRKGWL